MTVVKGKIAHFHWDNNTTCVDEACNRLQQRMQIMSWITFQYHTKSNPGWHLSPYPDGSMNNWVCNKWWITWLLGLWTYGRQKAGEMLFLGNCITIAKAVIFFHRVTFLKIIGFKLDSSESEPIELGGHHICLMQHQIGINLPYFTGKSQFQCPP